MAKSLFFMSACSVLAACGLGMTFVKYQERCDLNLALNGDRFFELNKREVINNDLQLNGNPAGLVAVADEWENNVRKEERGTSSLCAFVGLRGPKNITLTGVNAPKLMETPAWDETSVKAAVDELYKFYKAELTDKDGKPLLPEAKKLLDANKTSAQTQDNSIVTMGQRFRSSKYEKYPNIKGLPWTFMEGIKPLLTEKILRDPTDDVISQGGIDDIHEEIEKRNQAIFEAITELQRARERRDTEVQAAQRTLTDAQKILVTNTQSAQKQIQDAEAEYKRQQEENKKQTETNEQDIQKYKAELRELRELLREIEGKIDTEDDMTPDGELLDVDSKLGLAWIDLTIKDKVLPGMRFKVFANLRGLKPVEKGEIEVKKVDDIQSMCVIVRQNNPHESFEPGWNIVSPLYEKNPRRRYVVLGDEGVGDYSRDSVIAILRKMGHIVQEKPIQLVGAGTEIGKKAAKYGISTDTQVILLCKGFKDEDEKEVEEIARSYSCRIIRGKEFINMLGMPSSSQTKPKMPMPEAR